MKWIECNLESGMPDAATAVQKMKNQLATYRLQGYRAVLLIHGYGSSGSGGAIRAAVHRTLAAGELRGLVREYVTGSEWESRKRELVSICPGLREYERRFAGNAGVTLAILR